MVPAGFTRRVYQLVAMKTSKYCGKEMWLCYSLLHTLSLQVYLIYKMLQLLYFKFTKFPLFFTRCDNCYMMNQTTLNILTWRKSLLRWHFVLVCGSSLFLLIVSFLRKFLSNVFLMVSPISLLPLSCHFSVKSISTKGYVFFVDKYYLSFLN